MANGEAGESNRQGWQAEKMNIKRNLEERKKGLDTQIHSQTWNKK